MCPWRPAACEGVLAEALQALVTGAPLPSHQRHISVASALADSIRQRGYVVRRACLWHRNYA